MRYFEDMLVTLSFFFSTVMVSSGPRRELNFYHHRAVTKLCESASSSFSQVAVKTIGKVIFYFNSRQSRQ